MERATGIYIQRQYEDRYARVRTDELADVRLNNAGDHMRHTLHGLKAGSADIRGHQVDQPWTTSLDIHKEHLASQGLEDPSSNVSTTLMRRYHDAFQLRRKSFKATTVFGTYILYGMGIWQAHGAWRFFRFDPHNKSRDAIFNTSPGREFALLYGTPNRLDLLIVILGIDKTTGKHWVNAVCVDHEELTTRGANISKTLKDIRALYQAHRSFSNQKLVLLQGNSLYIVVRTQPRLVEGIPMHRVQLTRPWPYSWILFIKRGLVVVMFLLGNLCFTYVAIWLGAQLLK